MGSVEEVPRHELQPVVDPQRCRVLLEDRPDLGQVETQAGEMRMRERHLRREIALRRSHVDEAAILAPGKLLGDGEIGPAAHTRHGPQEFLEPRRVRVERGEQRLTATLQFVLGQPGPQTLSQPAPEPVEPVVRHFENAADVRGFALVEEALGRRRVAIDPVDTIQEAHGDERIEKVAG